MKKQNLAVSAAILGILLLCLISGCAGSGKNILPSPDSGDTTGLPPADPYQPPAREKAWNPSIVLKKGWNLIKYAPAISKKFTAVTMTRNGETKLLNDAVTAGWTHNKIRCMKGRGIQQIDTASTTASFLTGGQYYVFSAANGMSLDFNRPFILDITPGGGAAGAEVAISGFNFGSTGTATFQPDRTAAYSSWSDTRILCTVPAGTTSGKVTVRAQGLASNGRYFAFDEGVVTIVSSGAGGMWMALDDTNVYYNGNGDLYSAPLAGGIPTMISDEQLRLPGIAVSNGIIYWIISSDWETQVKSRAVSGGPITVLGSVGAAATGMGLAVGTDYIYCAESNTGNRIQRLAKSGGTMEDFTGYYHDSVFIVTDGSYIYWNYDCWFSQDARIMKKPVDGGPETTLALTSRGVNALRVDDDYVYWSQSCIPENGDDDSGNPGNAVMKVSKSGGEAITITSGTGPRGLAIDSQYVYWSESATIPSASGRIRKAPVGGGPITTVIENLNTPLAMEVDANNIYWIEGDSRSIKKLCKYHIP